MKQVGVEHQAEHDGKALHHAAGKLVRVQPVHPFRQVDQLEQFHRPVMNLRLGGMGLMHPVNILELTAQTVHRAQAVHGLLEYDGDPLPQQLLKFRIRQGQKILPVKLHTARDFGKAGIQLPQHGHNNGGLAGAAFADNTQRIAPFDAEGNVIHGLQLGLFGEIAHAELLHIQQQTVSLPYNFFIRGLSA